MNNLFTMCVVCKNKSKWIGMLLHELSIDYGSMIFCGLIWIHMNLNGFEWIYMDLYEFM